PKEILDSLNFQKAFFPYPLKYIEGKIIFNSVNKEIPLGSRILRINGVNDTALMQSFYKYMPSDGYNISYKQSGSVNNSFGIRYLLEYGLKDSFVITYMAPGLSSQQSVILKSVFLQERLKNLQERHSAKVDSVIDNRVQEKYSFQLLTPETAKLNFRIFTMAASTKDPAFKVYCDFIDSIFSVLNEKGIKNLIIDIRGNPGGLDPTYEQPMMYLTDSSFKENTLAYTIFDNIPHQEYFWGPATEYKADAKAKLEYENLINSYFTKFEKGRNLQNPLKNLSYNPKKPAFTGNAYLLIDENVGSAASHLASLFKAYARNGKIIGEETSGGYYGHNGHFPVVYELPNSKIKTKFSVVYVVQDAPLKPDQPLGRGVIPDYKV
ncbi:MAG: S41 family peptidase, partial [Ferruginibacter sp.]